MSNIVKYGSFSLEEAQAEREELQSLSGGGADFMKLAPGKNVIRVLPPLVGKRTFYKVHQHFMKIPGVASPVVFNCPRLMAKQPCAACQEMERLRRTGNSTDSELADSFYPRLRVFVNVIDRSNPDAGPKILAVGKKVYEQFLALADPDVGGDFTNPTDEGFDIVIERSGTGKTDTEYKVNPARKNGPLGNDAWIEMQHDLERYTQIISNEEMMAKMSGAAGAPAAPARGALPAGRPVARPAAAPPPARAVVQPAARRPAPPPPKARTAQNDVFDAEVEDE